MPALNRRRFLQFASAAGLAPVLPAIPTSAVAAQKGASTAQMLWASIYAKAGTAQKAVGVARGLGISGAAARGAFAQVATSGVLSAQSAAHINRVTRVRPAALRGGRAAPLRSATRPSIDVKKVLADVVDDTATKDVVVENAVETPTDQSNT